MSSVQVIQQTFHDSQFTHTFSYTNRKPNLATMDFRYGEGLELKHLPEMVFPDNLLHLEYNASGFVLEFNTLDAMKLMSTTDTHSVRVAMSEPWQASK